MTPGVFERVNLVLATLPPAEQSIAEFLLSHRAEIGFETAASVAAKLGVSAVTVGRFCRRLGYRHFRELKEKLKAEVIQAPWLAGEQLAKFRADVADDTRLQASLDLEIAGLAATYAFTASPEWSHVVDLLASSPWVKVVGFQTERGLASFMAHNLQYVRPGVHLVSSDSGHFSEALLEGSDGCLVIIETRRYSAQALQLCQSARRIGLPVILLTDIYCEWGPETASFVIPVPTESGLFWPSMVALTAAVNLLCNAVIVRLGDAVNHRLDSISLNYQDFVGHVSSAPAKPARKRGKTTPVPQASD